jgi:hypothetical protein
MVVFGFAVRLVTLTQHKTTNDILWLTTASSAAARQQRSRFSEKTLLHLLKQTGHLCRIRNVKQ